MSLAGATQLGSLGRQNGIDARELEYIAFSGKHDVAHGIFQSIPQAERKRYANKYILSEVITGGVKKLGRFLAASAEEPARGEKAFIDDTMDLFVSTCRESGVYPRELFESLLVWSDELNQLSLLGEALRHYDRAIELGVNRFPDLHVRTLLGKASVLNTLGEFREAHHILVSLAERPYIIADRNLIPEVLFNLGRESLLKGDVDYYKALLFRGLRHFYTSIENRKLFVDQIAKTYRRSLRVLLDPHTRITEKVLFLIHRLYFALEGNAMARLLGVTRATKVMVLGYVYYLNYVRRLSLARLGAAALETATPRRRTGVRRKNILVTRAMGGIGDLLMMTPGFHALKEKYPGEEIHLAIPRRYFPLFEGNPDVTLIDVEQGRFEYFQYRRWHNFTDCPAARIETRSAPRVTKGRIDIFARALGIDPISSWRMAKRPLYFVSDEEKRFQADFWKEHDLVGKVVIGVQLHADEAYREYPHMRQVVARVARDFKVLVFDADRITGYDGDNVTKVEGLPMRHAFALASACDGIIAPDSAFVHLAAAFDIPCVALFGPIDGKVRTAHYPKCTYLDVRKKLGCLPCWRNERIPCKLTNMRASVCMAEIAVEEVVQALTDVLQGRNNK